MHNHKCCKCGVIWGHECPATSTDAELLKLHTCPRCGDEQFAKYDRDDEAFQTMTCASGGNRLDSDPVIEFLSALVLALTPPK